MEETDPTRREQYEREVAKMIEKKLNTPIRAVCALFGLVGLLTVIALCKCFFEKMPVLPGLFLRMPLIGAASCVGVLTVLAACKTTYTVSAHYKPSENARPIVSPDTRFTLFVAPVSGPSDQLWYRIGGYTWFLEKSPTTLVEEALVDELELMGIRVTNDPSEGQESASG